MSTSEYAYVNARVRARKKDLLGEGELKTLTEATDLKEVISVLLNTPYESEMTKLPEEPTVGEVESALSNHLLNNYLFIINSVKGDIRTLLIEILRKFEVDNLKAILRSKYAGTPSSKFAYFPVEKIFKRMTSKLLEASSVDELIDLLDSPYKEVLEDKFSEYKKMRNLLPFENALNKYMFDRIWFRMNRLAPSDRSSAQRLIGLFHDSINIMTILRCKVEGINPEEIENYLLPYGFRKKEFVMADDVKSAVLAAGETYKGVLSGALDEFEKEKTLLPFELALRKHLLEESRNLLTVNPFQIGTLIGFLNLKENEVRNLRVIASSIEKLNPDSIRKLIVL